MSRLQLLGVLAALVLLTGCPDTAPAPPQTVETKTEAPPVAPKTIALAVHEVSCGCVLPDVKKCSEWVKVDETFVPLTNHGLKGKMPFCGKPDLKANVAGEIKDGKLVATSVEVLPK